MVQGIGSARNVVTLPYRLGRYIASQNRFKILNTHELLLDMKFTYIGGVFGNIWH